MEQNIKKCPKCMTEIDKKASVCPNCKTDLRNWFVRHWIISIFLLLFIIWTISNNSLENNSINEWKIDNKVNNIIVNNTENKKDLCNSVKIGDTKARVFEIMWEKASLTESEVDWIGNMEYLNYQETFSMESCQISIINGKVQSRTWVKL